MISLDTFKTIIERLGAQGQEDIAWAEGCCLPDCSYGFAAETIYVICNSGMRFTVARGIYGRVMGALTAGKSAHTVFGHKGKCDAIDAIWKDQEQLFGGFIAADDKVAYCRELPWIGPITSYHLAKNFGADVAKPDVHLQRLADLEGCTAQALCERLAAESGYRVGTVDTLIWRACATGILNSRTGQIAGETEAA